MSAADDVVSFEASSEIFIPHLGWLCYPVSDIVLLHLRQGSFEFREQAFLWSFLRPFDTFLDVGAHCVIFARIASHIISQDGKIFAIEPNPDVLPFLQSPPACGLNKIPGHHKFEWRSYPMERPCFRIFAEQSGLSSADRRSLASTNEDP